MKRIVLFGILLLTVTLARADVIVLNHGGRLEGRIERETENDVTIRLESGSMTVLRSDIREIERTTVSPENDPDAPVPDAPVPEGPASDAPDVESGSREGSARRHEAPAAGSIPLMEARTRQLIRAEAWGYNLYYVRLVLERRKAAATIYVPPGTMFDAPPLEPGYRNRVQDMVSVGGVNVTLPESGEVEVMVPVSCADLHRRIPTPSHLMKMRGSRPSAELSRLIATMVVDKASVDAQQAAVWVVTNDASYAAMSRLQTGIGGGARTILVPEAALGMLLCEKAGIDLDTKKIGQDDLVLVGALSDRYVPRDGPVRAFAMERLRKRGFRGRSEGEIVAEVLDRGKGRRLLVVACDVAAKGRFPEVVGPLKDLLDRCETDDSSLDPVRESHSENLKSGLARIDREAVALWAAKALAALGKAARPGPDGPRPGSTEAVVEGCLDALSEDGAGDEYRALRVLENLAPQRMSPALRRRVADDLIAFLVETGGRHGDQLGRALARYHDVLIPRDLETLTNAESPVARRVAARTLGMIERLTATEALVRLLQDEDADVRRVAADGLKGRQDAANALADLNLHPIPEVRVLAMDLLLELEGFHVERSLRDAVLKARGDRQKRMIARLGELECELASYNLVRLLQTDGDPEVRRLAAEALGRIGGRVARTALKSMEGTEEDRRVRREIELALRAIGSE